MKGIAAQHFAEKYSEATEDLQEKYKDTGKGWGSLPLIGDIITAHTQDYADIKVDLPPGGPRQFLGDTPKTMIEGLEEADQSMEDEIKAASDAQMISLAANFFLPNVSEFLGMDTTLSSLLGEAGGQFTGNLADKLVKRFATTGLNEDGVKMTIFEALMKDLPFLNNNILSEGSDEIAETVSTQV